MRHACSKLIFAIGQMASYVGKCAFSCGKVRYIVILDDSRSLIIFATQGKRSYYQYVDDRTTGRVYSASMIFNLFNACKQGRLDVTGISMAIPEELGDNECESIIIRSGYNEMTIDLISCNPQMDQMSSEPDLKFEFYVSDHYGSVSYDGKSNDLRIEMTDDKGMRYTKLCSIVYLYMFTAEIAKHLSICTNGYSDTKIHISRRIICDRHAIKLVVQSPYGPYPIYLMGNVVKLSNKNEPRVQCIAAMA